MTDLHPRLEPLPFANPFCTRFPRPGVIGYRFAADDSDAVTAQKMDRLVDAISRTPRSAIVGPHGSGKSTLLHSLWPRLENRFRSLDRLQLHASATQGYVSLLRQRLSQSLRVHGAQLRIWRQGRRQRTNQGSSLLVIDGFEQLTAAQRYQAILIARCCRQRLLVTTHHPARWFDRVHQSQPSVSVVLRLTDDLLKTVPQSTRTLVKNYLVESGSNQMADVREFWFQLYDVVAEASEMRSEITDAANRESIGLSCQ